MIDMVGCVGAQPIGGTHICQMDLVMPCQDHDISNMDYVSRDDHLREQWERYVDARNDALKARALQRSETQDDPIETDAPKVDAPIAKILYLLPKPRRGQ